MQIVEITSIILSIFISWHSLEKKVFISLSLPSTQNFLFILFWVSLWTHGFFVLWFITIIILSGPQIVLNFTLGTHLAGSCVFFTCPHPSFPAFWLKMFQAHPILSPPLAHFSKEPWISLLEIWVFRNQDLGTSSAHHSWSVIASGFFQ